MWKYKGLRGISVRDTRLLNFSILGKWRWRVMESQTSFWNDIILAMHGSMVIRSPWVGRNEGLKKACHWWKDVSLLGSKLDDPLNWFESIFSVQYERLLLVSEPMSQVVRGVDCWVEGVWVCDFKWSCSLLVWEEDIFLKLIGRINGTVKQG